MYYKSIDEYKDDYKEQNSEEYRKFENFLKKSELVEVK